MAKKNALEYSPDYAVPPGDTLIETLDAHEMTNQQLAEKTGLSLKTVNDICAGKLSISESVAEKLFVVLKVPAAFWLNLDSNYRATKLRLTKKTIKRNKLSVPKPIAKAV